MKFSLGQHRPIGTEFQIPMGRKFVAIGPIGTHRRRSYVTTLAVGQLADAKEGVAQHSEARFRVGFAS